MYIYYTHTHTHTHTHRVYIYMKRSLDRAKQTKALTLD